MLIEDRLSSQHSEVKFDFDYFRLWNQLVFAHVAT